LSWNSFFTSFENNGFAMLFLNFDWLFDLLLDKILVFE